MLERSLIVVPRVAAAAVLFSVAVGCGGAAQDNGALHQADASTASASDSAQDQGNAPDTPGEAADSADAALDGFAADSPPPIWIRAGHQQFGDTHGSFAEVWNGDGKPDERCVPHIAGGCLVIDCRASLAGDAKGADFGELTIAAADKAPVLLKPDSGGAYSVSGGAPFFQEEDVLSFAGAGGQSVESFHVEGLSVPGRPLLTTPEIYNPVGQTIGVDRTKDFTVAWSGAAENVVLTLEQFVNTGLGAGTILVQASCSYEGFPTGGTVPATVLGLFEADGPGLGSVMHVTNASRATLSSSGREIAVLAVHVMLYTLRMK